MISNHRAGVPHHVLFEKMRRQVRLSEHIPARISATGGRETPSLLSQSWRYIWRESFSSRRWKSFCSVKAITVKSSILKRDAAAQIGSSVSTITMPRSPSFLFLHQTCHVDLLGENLIGQLQICLQVVYIFEQVLQTSTRYQCQDCGGSVT